MCRSSDTGWWIADSNPPSDSGSLLWLSAVVSSGFEFRSILKVPPDSVGG